MIDAEQRKAMQAGTTLVATYKKQEHTLQVVEGADGRLRYRLADGREFKSPSAAGSAIMGGIACNGWRLWAIAGAEEAPAEGEPGEGATQEQPRAEERPRGAGRRTCENCAKSFVSDRQLEHHIANAERLCRPAEAAYVA